MKDSQNAIEVENITKKFKVYFDKGNQLKEKILFHNRNRYEEHWVLKGISFQVKKGEAIGLVGHNGCGKSTTLKLLSKIIYPDSGSIEMAGRVSSLIELGAGFHPDMSGRENIYTNAAIFGLTKKEIDARLDDIIAFSELEEFIDNPVRTYSSGMYMRLAFSVAINVDAEILLIDEILAVGDANFQAKCFNRLREIKAQGTTIVIVSHSLSQIEQICDRSIWIHDGEIRKEGRPRDVHAEYLGYMGEVRQQIADKEKERLKEKERQKEKEREKQKQKEAQKKKESMTLGVGHEDVIATERNEKRWGNGKVVIKEVGMYQAGDTSRMRTIFKTGEDVEVVVRYEVKEPIKDAVFGMAIYDSQGLHCYGTNTKIDRLDDFDVTKSGEVHLLMPKFDLLPEVYVLDVSIECETALPVDYYRQAYRFEMTNVIEEVGRFRLEHSWEIKEAE